ncbi:hypothetical protein Q9L58_005335 [Maublancomyces gigas]|uniref:Glutathione hydrolase n=1 Tax=Discina gigas TaxID=1032678 RepID=A0ABR3GIJ3_9PEZI
MRTPNFSASCAVICLLGHAAARPKTHQVKDDHGAVASSVDVCSHIGVDLMRDGGNAADAMIGTVLCVGTIGMYHSGIGGGGFVLVRTPAGKYDFIDFRETAPAGSSENMYANHTELSISGGLASAIPGELRGLEEIHKLYGSLPWHTLVWPSIKLARHGFIVGQDLAVYVGNAASYPFLDSDPAWALDFAPDGVRVKAGERMYRRRYADTLEAVAKRGVDAFYHGPIANATVQTLRRTGGIMTLEDLAKYEVLHRAPATLKYKGFKLTGCSAPSGGTVVGSTLNIFSGFKADFKGDAAGLTTHRLVEAMKYAYGQRGELGDPLFVPGMDEYQKSMLSAAAAAEIRSLISDSGVHNISAYDPKGLESLETPGTSHMVTADKSGLALTLTSTINLIFGSTVMVPETGVIMNNEMNDFSIPGSSNAFGYIPSVANYIRPGKRPLSSMSPSIVENPDGTLHLAIGAAGGSRIITATIQNIIHILDSGLSPYEALARPRLHDQLSPNTTSYEYGYDNATVAALTARGHLPVWVAPGQSSAQGIRRLANGTFEAAGEPRQKDSGGVAY